ncbi:Uncharacterized protein Fot_25511 [Forsythia ovata]|uniref:Uncharacterized protein n=1 Tax=Forsythia ovata TaxID=205694 RepID=A0ABD1U9Z1_9LAMI
MADIAMLVAEEYERRVKSSRIRGEEIELLSCVSVLSKRLEGSSTWIKMKLLNEKKMEILTPKSQMSVAATTDSSVPVKDCPEKVIGASSSSANPSKTASIFSCQEAMKKYATVVESQMLDFA